MTPPSESAPTPAPSHHFTDEQVQQYAEALKADQEAALPDAMRAHSVECPSCRGRILKVFTFLQRQKFEAPSEPPPAPAAPATADNASGVTITYIARVAAIFLGIIGLSVLLWWFRPAPDETVQRSMRVGELADQYMPNPELEFLIDKQLKNVPDIRVTYPPQITPRTPQMRFRWQPPGVYTVSIVNNIEKTIFEAPSIADSLIFRNTLPQGTYYVKFTNEEGLRFIGRFNVIP